MLRNLSSTNLGMANNAIKRYHNSLHSQNGRGMNNKSRKVVSRCVKKAKKGMGIKTSIKSGNFRPTKSGAGMTAKGVARYRRANPGSKLKTAVTGKVKAGSKSAKRRKSYCARSAGQLKRSSAKTRNDPNSRIRQARRRWKCR